MLKTSKLLKIVGAACLSVGAISICALAVNHSKTPVVEETEAADYYASITDDLEGQDLIDALHTLNTNNRTTTVGYDPMRYLFRYVDTCADANGKIVGFYNDALVGPEWDSGNTFNREHVWPNSLGGGTVDNDMHMVMPTSTSINSARGNSYYGNNLYDAGQYVAEYRGIAARIIFYCAISNTSLKVVDKNSGSSNEMGKLSDLLSWNLQYLPNSSSSASLAYKTEQYRNEIIDSNSSYGGNRNPFIDHPEYACRIWGDTNADTRNICGTSSTPSVTLNKTTVNLEPGASETITATINNGSGTISWTSSNENVATVSGGTITAKSTATVGQTAEITASVTISGTTYSKKCTVTIVASGGGSSSGDYSIVFKTGSDGSSEISYSNLLEQASSNTLVNNFSASSKCYAGASGLKLGSSGATGSFTAVPVSAAQSNVKSVTIESAKYGTDTGTLTLKLNGSNAKTGITPGTSYTHTFSTPTSVTSFGVVTSTKRAYVSSISFTIETPSSDPTLSSISVKTAPTKTSYTSGENFNPTGLVINRVFSDTSYNDTYTYSGHTSEFTFSPTTNTALKTSDTSVTITYGGKSCSQSITVSPTSITASVSKTYYVGETISSSDITVKDNDNQTVSGFTFANDGYQFQYSDAASGGALTNKAFANSITKGSLKASLTVQVQRKAYAAPTGSVVDTLTRETTGITSGSTVYDDWTYTSSTSSVTYTGQSAGDKDTLQIRSKNSNSGIVITSNTSAVTKVSVSINSNTQSGRVINIYGKTTAYSAPTDLYSSGAQGTLLGTIVYGTSTELTITGNYKFIGVRSNDGAIYLDSISFTVGSGSGSQTAANVANYIMYEDTNNQCNTKYSVAKGYFESMSASERNTFMTSSDYVVSTARARLQAWAASKGETISQSGGSYVIGNNIRINPIKTDSTTVLLVICVLSTLAGLTFIALSIKKRKEK